MLLNLTRVEGIQPETIILKSFHQFQNDLQYPLLQSKLLSLQRQLSNHPNDLDDDDNTNNDNHNNNTDNKNDSNKNDNNKNTDSKNNDTDNKNDSKNNEEEDKLVEEYYVIRNQLELLRTSFHQFIMHPAYSVPYLQPGRILLLHDWGFGILSLLFHLYISSIFHIHVFLIIIISYLFLFIN